MACFLYIFFWYLHQEVSNLNYYIYKIILTGDKGDAGAKGEPGNDGEDGEDGKQGPQGEAGVGLTMQQFRVGDDYTKGDYVFAKSSKGNFDSMFIAKTSFVAKDTPSTEAENWVEFHAPKGEKLARVKNITEKVAVGAKL